MNIENLTIDYLHQQYKSGKLTPKSLVNDLIEKSTRYTHKNIWIKQFTLEEITPYLDKLDIDLIDKQPLWGIPFVVKDNYDIEGIVTTAACKDFAYIANETAFVIQQLLNAGAILLGKANLDQFATGLVGVRSPEPWGACKNAFNDEYISGGSSSGSAVAVALGLATFSLGTDTAGSGRVPAAHNNIIGLKPTKGLLSTRGVVPACRSLDCVSIFATTTDDANKIFTVAAQFDVDDDYARKNTASNKNNYGQYKNVFSFAVPFADQLSFFGDKSAADLFEKSVTKLEAIGGIKTEVDFSPLFEAANLLYFGPWVAERYIATEKLVEQSPESLLPVIHTIVTSQQNASAVDAFKAFYQLQQYKQKADQIMEKFDILVTPTAGTIYTIDELQQDPIQLNSNMGYYTNYMNLLDYSGLALPAGFLDNQLPFGITLVGKRFDDTKLLAIGNLWQSANQLTLGATGWALPAQQRNPTATMDTVDVIVCGAHMEDLALNWQLTDRNAKRLKATRSSANYRLYALTDNPIQRPAMIRDEEKGSKINIEIWRLSSAEFGSFVANIPQPLGIGKVETEGGEWLPGFISESYATKDAAEITHLGGWREFLNQ